MSKQTWIGILAIGCGNEIISSVAGVNQVSTGYLVMDIVICAVSAVYLYETIIKRA